MGGTPAGVRNLLIANRGEIAVRIARAAHRMGIGTVGVYSETDALAQHVDAVDRAVALGGASAAESYLRADAVLQAALDTECDAVHPGYGFLAENADFAARVVGAGLVWVGPTPEQIRLLGDKVSAKHLAAEVGVPTTPVVVVDGTAAPAGIVFPALVKAAAGGGGRGMRVVHAEDDLAGAIEAASREAESAFGDGTVFVEPYVAGGRHVEVQVLGDRHGNVVHLGERDCSIQRRNQKVLEEAPAPGLADSVRAELCRSAVALARRVGYEGAGTVEFLVHPDGTVTFLEVNTRLQVEHPVTEAVTGLDLVELQLRIAAGEALPFAQDDIRITGHAIEARVVAEDPAAGWIPAGGTIRSFAVDPGVRTDAGVGAGSEVSVEYDSLLAKVVAHAPTRDEAARRLARALRTMRISGVRTDRHALVAILEEDDFLAGRTSTAYLDDHPEVVTARGPAGDARLALLLGAAFATEAAHRAADAVTGYAPSGWRNVRTRGQRQEWLLEGERHAVEYVIVPHGDAIDEAEVRVGPWPAPLEDGSLPPDDRRVVRVRRLGGLPSAPVLEVDGLRHTISTQAHPDGSVETWSSAGSLTWVPVPRFADPDHALVGGGPLAPLPGRVIAVHVEAGQHVTEGQVLMVVEAMKMEHAIVAPGDATVTAVHHAVGDRVDAGDLLVALEAHGERDDEASGS